MLAHHKKFIWTTYLGMCLAHRIQHTVHGYQKFDLENMNDNYVNNRPMKQPVFELHEYMLIVHLDTLLSPIQLQMVDIQLSLGIAVVHLPVNKLDVFDLKKMFIQFW